MKISNVISFLCLTVSVVIQFWVLGLSDFKNRNVGWHMTALFLNTLLIVWFARKHIISVNTVIDGKYLFISKHFFFVNVYRRKVPLKQIIRIWVGKKKLVVRTENESIQIPLSKLDKKVLNRLSLIQKYRLYRVRDCP